MTMDTLWKHALDLRSFILRDTTSFLATLLSFFIVAIVFLHVYYTFDTSPALIWPPVGLALALMILGGYRMWLPIFLGQLCAMLLLSPLSVFVIVLISGGYAVQAIAGLYVLRQFHFEADLSKLRNMIIFIGVALALTCISPLISTVGQALAGTLHVTPYVNLFRAWGGGVFSTLVVTPLILMWFPWKKEYLPQSRQGWFEIIAGYIVLYIANYFVFWTTLPQYIGIVVIFILPAVLIWFALRLHPRWLVLAVLVTSTQSIFGTFIARPSDNPISEQLLAVQIYIALVTAIFYVFVAVVEERRLAFLKLRDAYIITNAADKSKNEFIAILAHELRNPLAPVISSLEVLDSEEKDVEKKLMIKNTLEHTTMMRRLLDDLLDIVRLEQRRIELHKETVSLKELVRHALSSVLEKAKSLNHTVSVVLPEHDFSLYVDAVRIKQIIINILNNALKYTKEGGRIELTCFRSKDTLVIQVTDTGIGIDQDKMANIFEPFRQLGSSSRYSSGLGIGLFLTKQLIELHHGTIEVKSPGTNMGSTFIVSIPIVEQSQQETAAIETIPPVQPARDARTPARRILVVDDNKPAADILRKLLTLHKYDVDTAYSGFEALEKMNSFKPDAILLDIGMPDMDGYATAKAIRTLPWNGVIIALSGYGQESDKLQSIQSGFDDHLVKPVGIEEIMTALLTESQKKMG
jgi:signal transduction histidine kinase/CheY-like chemotaxis protein